MIGNGGVPLGKAAAIGIAGLTLLNFGAAAVRADSAVERGEALFAQCAVCHSLESDTTIVGPSLHGVFGRKAASVDSFAYSNAFYGADFVWDKDHLAKLLRDPAAMFPGTKMLTPGIQDPAQIADLIAYLEGATR